MYTLVRRVRTSPLATHSVYWSAFSPINTHNCSKCPSWSHLSHSQPLHDQETETVFQNQRKGGIYQFNIWNLYIHTSSVTMSSWLESQWILGMRQEYILNGTPGLHSIVNQPTWMYCEVGGNWRIQRNPTQARGEHTKLHNDSKPSSGLDIWNDLKIIRY